MIKLNFIPFCFNTVSGINRRGWRVERIPKNNSKKLRVSVISVNRSLPFSLKVVLPHETSTTITLFKKKKKVNNCKSFHKRFNELHEYFKISNLNFII